MSVIKSRFNLSVAACILALVILGCENRVKDNVLESMILFPNQNQEIWEGEMIYFEGAVSGGISPYTYRWDFGVEIPPSSEKKPGKIVFNYEGAYKVLFTVKDSKGHVNSDLRYVVVKRKEIL